MGTIHATAAIRNPAEPDRVWEGLFLVDTGATDYMMPRQRLESIAVEVDPRNETLKKLPAAQL